jgi:hypothetical protein
VVSEELALSPGLGLAVPLALLEFSPLLAVLSEPVSVLPVLFAESLVSGVVGLLVSLPSPVAAPVLPVEPVALPFESGVLLVVLLFVLALLSVVLPPVVGC